MFSRNVVRMIRTQGLNLEQRIQDTSERQKKVENTLLYEMMRRQSNGAAPAEQPEPTGVHTATAVAPNTGEFDTLEFDEQLDVTEEVLLMSYLKG